MIYGYAGVSTRGQAAHGNSLEDQRKILRENGAEEIYVMFIRGRKFSINAYSNFLKYCLSPLASKTMEIQPCGI